MIRIAGTEKESIVDGEGIRYVIFTQGCSHNCPGCQNPHTHDFNGGYNIDDKELLLDIDENPLLDGVTFSGGDPMFQAKNLLGLAKACKDRGLSIWLYTGFEFEQFLKFKNGEQCDERITQDMIDLLEIVDVVVDGRFIESKKTMDKAFAGSSNQRIIKVKETIKSNKIVYWE